MTVLDYAVRLHAVNPCWTTFFREVFAPGGLVSKHPEFRNSDEYLQLVKMFDDLLEADVKNELEPMKVIKVRMPKAVHEALVDKADGTPLNRFILVSLLKLIVEKENEEGLAIHHTTGHLPGLDIILPGHVDPHIPVE